MSTSLSNSNSLQTSNLSSYPSKVKQPQQQFNRYQPQPTSSQSSKNLKSFHPSSQSKSSQALHNISQTLSSTSSAANSNRITQHHNHSTLHTPYGLHQNALVATPNPLTASSSSNRLATSPGIIHSTSSSSQFDNRIYQQFVQPLQQQQQQQQYMRNASTSPQCHTIRSDNPATTQLILHKYPLSGTPAATTTTSASISSFTSIPDDNNFRYTSSSPLPLQQKFIQQQSSSLNSFAPIIPVNTIEPRDHSNGIRVVHSIHSSEPRSRNPSTSCNDTFDQHLNLHHFQQMQSQHHKFGPVLSSSARQLSTTGIPIQANQQQQQQQQKQQQQHTNNSNTMQNQYETPKPITLLHHFSNPNGGTGQSAKQHKINRPVHICQTENSTSISKLENSVNLLDSQSFLRSARDQQQSSTHLHLPHHTMTNSVNQFHTIPKTFSQEPKPQEQQQQSSTTLPKGSSISTKQFSQSSQLFYPPQVNSIFTQSSPTSVPNRYKQLQINQQPLTASINSKNNPQVTSLLQPEKLQSQPQQKQISPSQLPEQCLSPASALIKTQKGLFSSKTSIDSQQSLKQQLKVPDQSLFLSTSENPSGVLSQIKPVTQGVDSLQKSQRSLLTTNPNANLNPCLQQQMTQVPTTSAAPVSTSTHHTYLYQHLGYNSSSYIDLKQAISGSNSMSSTARQTFTQPITKGMEQQQHQQQQQKQKNSNNPERMIIVDQKQDIDSSKIHSTLSSEPDIVLPSSIQPNSSNSIVFSQSSMQTLPQNSKPLPVDVLLNRLNSTPSYSAISSKNSQPTANPSIQQSNMQINQTQKEKIVAKSPSSDIESAFHELKITQQCVLPSRNTFPIEGYTRQSSKPKQLQINLQTDNQMDKLTAYTKLEDTSTMPPSTSSQFSDIIGLKQKLSSFLESTDRITERFKQHKIGANLILQNSSLIKSKNISKVSTPSSESPLEQKQQIKNYQPSNFSSITTSFQQQQQQQQHSEYQQKQQKAQDVPKPNFNSIILNQKKSEVIKQQNSQENQSHHDESVKRSSKEVKLNEIEDRQEQNFEQKNELLQTSEPYIFPNTVNPKETISLPLTVDNNLKQSLLYGQHCLASFSSKNVHTSEIPLSLGSGSSPESPDFFKSITKSSNLRKNIVFSLATEASYCRNSNHAFGESDNLESKTSHQVLTSRIIESNTNDFVTSTDSLSVQEPVDQQIHLKELQLEHFQQLRPVEQPLNRRSVCENYCQKDFYLIRRLGRGKHSEVFLAQDKATGFLFAVKQIYKGEIIGMEMEQQLSQEIRLQSLINHPNVLSLYGFIEDRDYMHLFMEYAPSGEISSYLAQHSERRFSEPEAAYYLSQLASALVYLHSKNIVHRDIKPDNLLFSNGVLKLADFGYSSLCKSSKMRTTFCGTLDYLSPKMINGENYGIEVDVWSFGVLAYEFLQGVAPFYEDSKDATMRKISQGKFEFIHPISSEAQDFISSLLESNPDHHISMRSIINHPWLRENSALFQQKTTASVDEKIIVNDPLTTRVL